MGAARSRRHAGREAGGGGRRGRCRAGAGGGRRVWSGQLGGRQRLCVAKTSVRSEEPRWHGLRWRRPGAGCRPVPGCGLWPRGELLPRDMAHAGAGHPRGACIYVALGCPCGSTACWDWDREVTVAVPWAHTGQGPCAGCSAVLVGGGSAVAAPPAIAVRPSNKPSCVHACACLASPSGHPGQPPGRCGDGMGGGTGVGHSLGRTPR